MGDGDATVRGADHPPHQRPHAARGYWRYRVLPEARDGSPVGYSGNPFFLLLWHMSASDRLSCASSLRDLRPADTVDGLLHLRDFFYWLTSLAPTAKLEDQ
jgi:hypothetical protein